MEGNFISCTAEKEYNKTILSVNESGESYDEDKNQEELYMIRADQTLHYTPPQTLLSFSAYLK